MSRRTLGPVKPFPGINMRVPSRYS
jgi:hypothetical protein